MEPTKPEENKEEKFAFPAREPRVGEIALTTSGDAYLTLDSTGLDGCSDCDLANGVSVESCSRYKQCSAFWRGDKKPVRFRAVENFDEALAQTLLTRADPIDFVTYPTGAKRERDDRKPRYDLISPLAEERIARRLAEGAEKYGERNWEKGVPISRCVASALRHLHAYRRGEIDEDHLAATVCNLMFALHFEESVKIGDVALEIFDLPFHAKRRRVKNPIGRNAKTLC